MRLRKATMAKVIRNHHTKNEMLIIIYNELAIRCLKIPDQAPLSREHFSMQTNTRLGH
jgi:hypothetical protein